MCAGSCPRSSVAIERRLGRRPMSPSWSSTGTPSRVSQTSLSSPVAPSRQPERERFQGVLRGVGAGAAMGEHDGPVQRRRQPLLHDTR